MNSNYPLKNLPIELILKKLNLKLNLKFFVLIFFTIMNERFLFL